VVTVHLEASLACTRPIKQRGVGPADHKRKTANRILGSFSFPDYSFLFKEINILK
jgi:hypothetical protein